MTTVSWVQRTLIVPTEFVEFARLLTKTIAGSSGANMWTSMLSYDSSLPPTHWISSGLIDEKFANLLPMNCINFGEPETCAYLATKAGVPTTIEQIQSLFNVVDVTEEDGLVAMHRLGLTRVIEEDQLCL